MKTRKALPLFFCAVAFVANAATVSVDTAKLAAGSWALSDAALGVAHGRTVSGATVYDVGGKPGFYAVKLNGGGTLFLAADDDLSPIIAFTASSSPDLSQGSYLRTMLEKDIEARRGCLSISTAAQAKLTASSGAPVSSSPAVSPAKKMWAALVPAQAAMNPKLTMASATPRDTGAISDMRVEPLVKSQWSQQEAGGGYCYNYYTPGHDPCGCTATAASQIMRFFEYPNYELPKITRLCTVDDVETELSSIGDSRIYDWANMKLIPKNSATDAEREAIGRLTYDVGVAVYSAYTASGTGADPQKLGELYQDTYGYASGVMYWNTAGWDTGNGGLHTREIRNKIIYANLDAGRPVQVAIYFSGHSVVCDGYGFVTLGDEAIEFAHINMGWAGTDDMWYNIPEIDAANSGAHAGDSGMKFEYMGGAQFNIHPTETGDLLTGRVVDDGEPVEGATVSVYVLGSSTPVATTTSDVHGIYSFCLEGGRTYNVTAVSTDGKKSGTAEGIVLQTTVEDDFGEFAHNVTQESRVGNSWGNDIDIVIPHVRIVGDRNYPNLSAALDAASTMENPVVEIFGPTTIKGPMTITTNVTIRTVPDYSADFESVLPTLAECEVVALNAAVTAGGWALQIADGVRVDFSNIVVRAESGEPLVLDVLETGRAAFAGRVDLGTVATRTADAFVLAGAFETAGAGLAVSYPEATARFSQFGTYECSAAAADSCAKWIIDAVDPTMTGSVGDGGALVWDRVSVDSAIAIAYATDSAIGTTHYLSVDLLFKDYTNGAEVVFLKNCPADKFTNSVVVTKSMNIRSEGAAPFVVTAGKDAGFIVQGDGVELTFSNVVFTRPESSTLSFVTVADGASFTLADGGTIADLRLAGTASAVYVEKGRMTMQDGSAITNCVATRLATCKAGGIYLKDADCTFDFAGGEISGCRTGSNSGTGYSGGVFAAPGATVYVSGSATAYGNKAGVNATESQNRSRNIYVPSYERLILSGGLTGGDIGVYCVGGTAEGASFATVGDGASTALVDAHFRNDNSASLYASVSDDGATLVWSAEPPGPKPVPESEAEARIVVGGSTAAYATIGDAFEAADMYGADEVKIELLKDAVLSNSVTIAAARVLDGKGFTLSRAGDYCISVMGADASLSVADIVLDGGSGKGRVLDVQGGSLVLESGTIISGVTGSDSTMVAPVVVWNGSFVMNSGAAISGCFNSYAPLPGGPLTAGAVVVDGRNAHAEFRGGTISGCTGARSGGVTIANDAEVRVSGDVKIKGNKLVSGEECNFVVHDHSSLVLTGLLTGRIGYTEGVNGDTNVFGTVDADFFSSTTASNVVVSARRFIHDETAARGMVATNETEAILVWSSAVGDSYEFTNVVDSVTNVYGVVRVAVDEDDDEPEIVECAPFAFAAIEEVSPGTWKLTLKPGTEHCTYTLKCSADLKTWTTVGSSTELSAGDISGAGLEFFFEVNDSDGKKFWKVEGVNGIQ